jgi:hypothetical protein
MRLPRTRFPLVRGNCRSEGVVPGEKAMKKAALILIAVVMMAGRGGSRQVAAATGGAEGFAQLKSLVGHWEEQKVSENKSTLDVELTAGGTTVLEKSHMVEQGKPVEMITMYYLDGGQVKLTHYCMAGNQPTMHGTYAAETKTLTFDFEKATNLKSANDGHMHHAVYKFIDNDHFQTTWTFQKDQKDAFTEDVIYARK